MKAKVIFGQKHLKDEDCSGSSCPTIYETGRGTYLVQGKIVENSNEFGLTIPSDERLVEIPKSFLEAYKNI